MGRWGEAHQGDMFIMASDYHCGNGQWSGYLPAERFRVQRWVM